jgi:DNA-nicking Smr family endonuclease
MAASNFGDILRRWEQDRREGGTNQKRSTNREHSTGQEPGTMGESGMRKPRTHRIMEEYLADNPPVVKEGSESGPEDSQEHRRPGSVHAKRLPIDDTLDLHGLTRAEAERRTDRFIREAQRRGHQKVLVVYGKGLHSREGAVLRRAIQRLLQDHPLTGAMGTPERKDGGTGAAWVRIRPPSR